MSHSPSAQGFSKSDRIVTRIMAALLALTALGIIWAEGIEIVRDYRLGANTERVSGARKGEGGCRSRFIVTWCTVAFARGSSGEPIFKETVIYIGRDAPSIIEFRQERGNPAVMTTDLALSTVNNRAILFAIILAGL